MEGADKVNIPVQASQEKPQRKFFGLSQNVFIFGFVSLLTDFSSEVTVKTLPLFLANALGVQPAIIGFIEGLAETTATILKWVFGWLSDRLKKRKWLAFTGYAISNITKPLLYFVSSWPLAAFLRFADRTGKGVRSSPKDALLADSSEKKKLGRSFGYGRSMDTVRFRHAGRGRNGCCQRLCHGDDTDTLGLSETDHYGEYPRPPGAAPACHLCT